MDCVSADFRVGYKEGSGTRRSTKREKRAAPKNSLRLIRPILLDGENSIIIAALEE